MSAVTLADLRADFEACKAMLMASYGIPTVHCWTDYRMFEHRNDLLEPALEDFCRLRLLHSDYDEVDYGCKAAANLLDVAEKHGLEAAMLFKLSDGQIDPRKGGDA